MYRGIRRRACPIGIMFRLLVAAILSTITIIASTEAGTV
jgi:hypothetical protein